MEEAAPHVKKQRVMDRSNAIARGAISGVIRQFAAWRLDLARFSVVAERNCSESDRERMLERCATIEREVRDARVTLIEHLMDAPRNVIGHSRVADVEKALDGVEADAVRIVQKVAPRISPAEAPH